MYLVERAFAKSKECSVLYFFFFFFRDTFPAGQKERERWEKTSEIKTQVYLRPAVP